MKMNVIRSFRTMTEVMFSPTYFDFSLVYNKLRYAHYFVTQFHYSISSNMVSSISIISSVTSNKLGKTCHKR